MGGLGGASYHGVAFLVLGLLTPAAFPTIRLVAIWIALLTLGGAIELAQGMMQVNRHAEWSDFGVDALAASVGIVFTRILLRTVSLWRAKGAKNENGADGEAP